MENIKEKKVGVAGFEPIQFLHRNQLVIQFSENSEYSTNGT